MATAEADTNGKWRARATKQRREAPGASLRAVLMTWPRHSGSEVINLELVPSTPTKSMNSQEGCGSL